MHGRRVLKRAHGLPGATTSSRVLQLPKVEDPRGNLAFLEERRHVGFELNGVRWLRHDHVLAPWRKPVIVPGAAVIVAAFGALRVRVVGPAGKRSFDLLTPDCALHLGPKERGYVSALGGCSQAFVVTEQRESVKRAVQCPAPLRVSAARSRVEDCRGVELISKTWRDPTVVVAEGRRNIPFKVRRVYFLYGVPRGGVRGAHAHTDLHQVLIAVRGSFEVVLDDGWRKRTVRLESSEKGLLLVPGIWRELRDFSKGAVCLVLASDIYRADGYVRDYTVFCERIKLP